MSGKKRLGNYFIAIGVVLLFLFFISDYVEDVVGWYLLLGVIFFGLGVWLAWQGRTPPQPSRRFRMVRRMMGKKVPDDRDDEEAEE